MLPAASKFRSPPVRQPPATPPDPPAIRPARTESTQQRGLQASDLIESPSAKFQYNLRTGGFKDHRNYVRIEVFRDAACKTPPGAKTVKTELQGEKRLMHPPIFSHLN